MTHTVLVSAEPGAGEERHPRFRPTGADSAQLPTLYMSGVNPRAAIGTLMPDAFGSRSAPVASRLLKVCAYQ